MGKVSRTCRVLDEAVAGSRDRPREVTCTFLRPGAPRAQVGSTAVSAV